MWCSPAKTSRPAIISRNLTIADALGQISYGYQWDWDFDTPLYPSCTYQMQDYYGDPSIHGDDTECDAPHRVQQFSIYLKPKNTVESNIDISVWQYSNSDLVGAKRVQILWNEDGPVASYTPYFGYQYSSIGTTWTKLRELEYVSLEAVPNSEGWYRLDSWIVVTPDMVLYSPFENNNHHIMISIYPGDRATNTTTAAASLYVWGAALHNNTGVCHGHGIPEGFCDCAGNVLDCRNVCGGQDFSCEN